MIDKKTYIKCVQSIIDFEKSADSLYSATNGVLDVLNWDELQKLLSTFEDFIELNTNDSITPNDPISELEYFLYECNYGETSVDEYGKSRITDAEDNSIYMRNPEELYDNFILTKQTIADYIRNMTDEELAKYLMDFYKTGYVIGSIADKIPNETSVKEQSLDEILSFIQTTYSNQTSNPYIS